MPPAFPDARLRRAGISAARVAQLQAAYNAMDTWQQQRFRSVVASAPDEVLRRTYDPAGVPDVPVTPAQVAGDPAVLTAVQAAILAAHDTDAEREAFVPARLSAAAIAAITAAVGGKVDSNDPRLFDATIGPSNRTDDTAAINALLSTARAAGGGLVKGTPGQTYKISAPLVIGSGTTLDMTGCTVAQALGSQTQLLRNYATTAVATAADGAMTAGSAVLTTAVAASVGQSVTVAGALSATGGGPLTATVTAVAPGSLTLSAPAQATVTGATVTVYTRDTNIRVIGGAWRRPANGPNGAQATAAASQAGHSFWFRHVDGLVIQPEIAAATGGMRVISVGDITAYTIDAPNLAAARVGIQVNGPAYRGRIGYVNSTFACTDDLVAVTANDYTTMADVAGHVIDLSIGTVLCSGNYDGVKLLAGANTKLDRIAVGEVLGTVTNGLCLIGEDNSNPGTIGGTYGDVDIRWLGGYSTNGGPTLGLQAPSATSIRAKGSATTNNAVSIYSTSSTATIGLLHLSFACTGINGNAAQLIAAGITINKLILDGWQVTAPATGGTQVFSQGNGLIGEIVLRDCGGVFSTGVTGRGFFQYGGTANKIVVQGGTYDHALNVVETKAATKVIFRGVDCTNSGRLVNITAGAATVDIGGGCSISGNVSSPIYVAGGPLTLTGDFANYTASSLLQRAASETVRVKGLGMPVNLALVAKNNGDTAYNTNGSLTPVSGTAAGLVGPCVCDGTIWKNLATGSTF